MTSIQKDRKIEHILQTGGFALILLDVIAAAILLPSFESQYQIKTLLGIVMVTGFGAIALGKLMEGAPKSSGAAWFGPDDAVR